MSPVDAITRGAVSWLPQLEAARAAPIGSEFVDRQVSYSPTPDLDEVALNPQPLPPRERSIFRYGLDPEWRGLNPQPLPPRLFESPETLKDPSQVELNPQPLPPRPPLMRRVSAVSESSRHLATRLGEAPRLWLR